MADFFFGSPFRRLVYGRPFVHEWGGSAAAAMDWIETPSSHILKLDVPGLGKDDIKIQIDEGNVLSIKGTAPAKEETAKEAVWRWHVAERGKADFVREIALPENIKADQIKAKVDNGVLTVVVPKEPVPARPKHRPVTVSSKL